MTSGRKGSADKSIPHVRLEDEEMIWETYENKGKLGQGAFGKVYEVEHKSTSLHWAMKTVNKEKAGSSAIKLLEREVAILKRVTHPNIIQLYEVFETSKRMFLVMELCEGGELADMLKDRKFFCESEVRLITKELASAIAYLHKNDIVHRDIKLENILVGKLPDPSNPQEKLQIKVTDFGLSITKTGVGHDNMMQDFCGTPNYMAPEIIDNKTYSQQCDVWALGIIVYSLFCGYPPFRSKDEDTLYDLIKKGEIEFTSPDKEKNDLWNEVSNEAKSCIKGMLNVDPAHRLTASEILDHHWITGEENSQKVNVLELMKQWGKDLNINDVDMDEEEGKFSAINGDVTDTGNTESQPSGSEQTDGAPENHTNDSSEPNGTEQQSTSSEGRKGSGGTKKPGSGGKEKTNTKVGSRVSVGLIPRTTSTTLKPTSTTNRVVGAKSPMPSTKVSSLSSSQPRPSTQGTGIRSNTMNSSNRNTTAKTMTNSKLNVKGVKK